MLPDVLLLPDGSRATDAATWRTRHRPELLALLERHVYGTAAPVRVAQIIARRGPWPIAGGTAEELELALWPNLPPLTLMLARPTGTAPAPCLVGLNFTGNHTLVSAPVTMVDGLGLYGEPRSIPRNQHAPDWCIEALVARGWAVATAFYGELEHDAAQPRTALSRRWQSDGIADGGALSSWAWQLQRIIDVLVADPAIDARRLVAVGHSRLGKAALWAAAQDERIAAVIANQSGCGGAAPARQCAPDAETIRHITARFGYWFSPAYALAADDPTVIPVDQHHLLALIAPRPLILSNAEGDRWADPAGQLAAMLAAAPAWFDTTAAAPTAMPPVGSGGGHRLRWWWRLGPHALTPAEWAAWLPILDEELPA